MKVMARPLCGSYRRAMEMAKEIDATPEGLRRYLHTDGKITVEPYGGVDPRNGWDTHIASVGGKAVAFLSSGVRQQCTSS